ncbi:copper chaperone PCu(A)C [Psychromicrobium sp. YIM B11713]|uniref:copper chaperone PCu(A)C n=1 Tax=Psychromicrobium sp. YIM B11713 TaxID=3145233 RepID=UPI00374FBC3D
MNKKTLSLTITSLAIVSLALTGCGSSSSSTASTTAQAAQNPASSALTIEEAWVKANGTEMTGAFGVLKNSTDQDITVSKASTPSAGMVELHETVMASDGTMKMQPKKGGFVIPAKGQLELKPGGNHIMLMEIAKAINPGDELGFELTLSNGQSMSFKAPAKAFSGAIETYAG